MGVVDESCGRQTVRCVVRRDGSFRIQVRVAGGPGWVVLPALETIRCVARRDGSEHRSGQLGVLVGSCCRQLRL